MKEGLYVHVDEIRNVIDTLGRQNGQEMAIDEEYVLSEIKQRSSIYITQEGHMVRRNDKRRED